jgi:hypothetical protein
MDKPKQERRNEARRRALKGARIVFGRHNALIDCTVSKSLSTPHGILLSMAREISPIMAK